MGWPLEDPSAFDRRASWINTTTNFKDVWFCTLRQKEAALNTKNKPKALRRHANATDLKAIWIDADVKPDDTTGKHYTSMGEAWDALCAFRIKVGLPQFSAVVNSGGGLHIYWISDIALDQGVVTLRRGLKALLLKEGVKCDAGLTTDDVRLLRVPGTFNHKYSPPREVALLPLPLVKYKFETTLAFLKTVAPAAVTTAAGRPYLGTPVWSQIYTSRAGAAVARPLAEYCDLNAPRHAQEPRVIVVRPASHFTPSLSSNAFSPAAKGNHSAGSSAMSLIQ